MQPESAKLSLNSVIEISFYPFRNSDVSGHPWDHDIFSYPWIQKDIQPNLQTKIYSFLALQHLNTFAGSQASGVGVTTVVPSQ